MSQVFRLKEVLEFAVKKEKQSQELYQKLSENADSKETKKVFEKLYDQEMEHAAFYEKMLSQVADEKAPGSEIQHEEFQNYMRTLMDESRAEQKIFDLSSLNVVLDFAINRERDSVKFYTQLKEFITETEAKQMKIIIEEERYHIKILEKIK